MPISQSRMIALIHAALDYQQAFEKACRTAKRERELALQGRQSFEDACQNIFAFISPIMLNNPGDSKAIISIEKSHFDRNARQNIRRAKRQAEKRGTSPGAQRPQRQLPVQVHYQVEDEPRSTSPASMTRQTNLHGSTIELIQAELAAERAGAVNPFDPIDEDELDLESIAKGSGLSDEAKRQIQAQVEFETAQEGLPDTEQEASPEKPKADRTES